jgi:glycerol-3-phosphate acyltransferase PlsY
MCIVAYLIGSIPVAYLVGRLHGINIFKVGSGNMGAGNIARAVSKTWGGITWLLDSMKAIVAILIVREIAPPDHLAVATMIGSIAAIVGHIWSIFVWFITGRFRGGKGAATAIGTWFLFIPLPLIAVVMSIWVLIVVTTRLVSLAVLTAIILISASIISLVLTGSYEPLYLSYLLVSALVIYRHRANIEALLEGRERRLGDPSTY